MNNTLVRRIRLVTGLVLLPYVISHLANLALGLMALAPCSWRYGTPHLVYWCFTVR